MVPLQHLGHAEVGELDLAYVRRGVRGGVRLVRVRVVSGEVDPAST